MKILITGIRGFVASAIARNLCSAGNLVVGIGRTPSKDGPGDFIPCDISNASAVDDVLENGGFDVIVHAAACLSNDAAELFSTNILGTENIVKGCEKYDVGTIVFLSSIQVVAQSNSAIDETAMVRPPTAYHLSKAVGERLLENVRGVRGVIFRFASPVGAGMPRGKIFSTFVQNALNNEDIYICGNGERVQNYISVDDIATAVAQGVVASKLNGVYHLGGVSISDRDLAELCVEALGAKSRISVLNKVMAAEKWYINDSKIRSQCRLGTPRSLRSVVVEVAEEMKMRGGA